MIGQKETAIYAIDNYSFILPYFTWFTGEQFANEIEARFEYNARTEAVIDAVRNMIQKIYRTPAGVRYYIYSE